ncbi:C40 family peptidase [Gulosibacter faecalis]|uniref:C40 family peptidase n=1 Tax=Gulosibacter faecalis TaxID=272240 RepID=A0ABW5UU61_9MICO|nr:C40 family peptidase [Gulosibacter faecalis]
MDNTTPAGALTRREAREIERRTGVRPVAVAAASPQHDELAAFRRAQPATPTASVVTTPWDTGRIDRNELDTLLSVIPEDLAAEAAAAAPADRPNRGLTVRADRPAALVARSRRRAAGGFAAAASVTALAAVGFTSVIGQGAVVADEAHRADLLGGINAQDTVDDVLASDEVADDATEATQQADATAEESTTSAPAAESTELTEIESFDAASVQSAAEEPAVEEVPADETSATEVSADASAEASTAASATASTSATSGSSLLAIGEQYIGVPYVWGGTSPSMGFDCAGFVAWVLNEAGYDATTSIAQLASMGEVTTNPQPGDLVIYDGHIGFYAGPNSMLHAPYAGDSVRYGTIDWGSHYFVHLG